MKTHRNDQKNIFSIFTFTFFSLDGNKNRNVRNENEQDIFSCSETYKSEQKMYVNNLNENINPIG
jgi:hypothetical protein